MGEMSKGVSVATVEAADALAVTVLSLMDAKATGERSVQDIMAEAIEQADRYRRSRMADVPVRRG